MRDFRPGGKRLQYECLATLKRIFLVFFGLSLALLILWAVAQAFQLRPLDMAERLSVLNREQLSYDGIDETCDAHQTGTIDVFGGSSVVGVFASPGADFPHVMDRDLPEKWHVLNRARSAKNSFWALHCMEQTIGDGARIWIVYEGHNDFIDLSGPHLERSIYFENHPKALLILDALLNSPASAVLRPFFRVAPVTVSAGEHDQQVQRILNISEGNYRKMVELARGHGIKLVLCTVISNLDYPPISQPPTGEVDGWSAERAFVHAQELYKEGNAKEGYRFETMARDRDPRVWRAPSAFNELMRRLANENSDVVKLIDLERNLERDYGSFPIGCNLFGQNGHCDWVHPNDLAHGWIAKQIEKELL